MEFHEVLLLVHIVAAMVWLGGGVLAGVMASRMKVAEPQNRLWFARTMKSVSVGLFMPAAILVLGTGVWIVLDSDLYAFDQAWISAAFAIVIIAGAMGPLFFKPTIDKGIAAMEAGDGPTAGALMARLGMGSKIALVLEFVGVYLMVFKPGA